MSRLRLFTFAACALVFALLAVWFARAHDSARVVVPVPPTAEPSSGKVDLERSSDSAERVAIATTTEPEAQSASAAASDETPRVVVLVVDQDEVPIADATVEVVDEGSLGAHRTGADGRCTLPIAVANVRVQLRVTARGFVDGGARTGRAAEIRIELAKAVGLRGRVVSARKRAPIAGARVYGIPPSGSGGDAPIAITDTTGDFALDGMADRTRTKLRVAADGFATTSCEARVLAGSEEMVIELEPGVVATFLVVDAVTHAPIAGAKIENSVDSVVSDANGRAPTATLLAASAHETHLFATANGYCSLHGTLRRGEVDDGRILELALLQSARLDGRVIGDDGAPLASARVVLELRNGTGELTGTLPNGVSLPERWSLRGSDDMRTGSDAEGRFVIDGLQPWARTYRLAAFAGADVRKSVTMLAPIGEPGTTSTIEVVLASRGPVGVVTGSLTFNGNPVAGSIAWKGPSRAGSGRVEADGRFRIEDVECGKVVLTPHVGSFYDDERCTALSPKKRVGVESGQETRIDFPLVAPSATIRGRVTTADGAPVPNVDVDADQSHTCWRADAQTDADGRFELEVDAGVAAYRVRTGEGANEIAVAGVAPGTDDVELVLPGVSRVRVRVVDARTLAPLARFTLNCRGERGEQFDLDTELPSLTPFTVDAQGWYSFALHAGRWQFIASDVRGANSDHLPTSRDVVLEPGDRNPPIEFACAPCERVEVQLAPEQTPWPESEYQVLLVETSAWDGIELGPNGWTLRSHLPTPFFRRIVKLDAKGGAQLSGFEPGKLRFKVFPPTMTISPETIEVPVANDEPVIVGWSRN